MRNHANAQATPNALRAQYTHLLTGGAVTQAWVDAHASRPDFWEQAWREGVGACVWHALLQQGVRLDPVARAQCIEQPLRGQVAHTLMLRAGTAEVLRLFAEADIDVVMLRGQSIADVLYSPSTLRPQTDIDLLIGEADVQRAAGLLVGAGFAALPNHPLLFARGEVLLDVHTEPLGIERIASWALLTPLRAEDFFRRATRGSLLGIPAMLPDASVYLPYLCFHAMKHSFESLVWLWDIALLAKTIGENDTWQEVSAGIEAYGLQRPCFFALSYATSHLAAPVPESLLVGLRPEMDWRERSMFSRFMQHEKVPFLAERVFSRMQPDAMHRLAFWRETIWPSASVRRQVNADPSATGGFTGKRLRQIGKAVYQLLRELGAMFRRS
jgi:hypothetical protein